jgi:hypothetical protein
VDPERIGLGPAPPGLSPVERRVYQILTGPKLPGAVAREAGLSQGESLAVLIGLELRGLIRGSGGRFQRTVAVAGAPGSA